MRVPGVGSVGASETHRARNKVAGSQVPKPSSPATWKRSKLALFTPSYDCECFLLQLWRTGGLPPGPSG